MKSSISTIVRDNNLKPGDVMKSISGADIEGSVVLSKYECLIRRDGPFPGYDLIAEAPLSGVETTVSLSNEAVAILRRFEG